MGPNNLKRFIHRCTAYLSCVANEAKLRETRVVLDPESYTAARRENSAVRACYSLFSMALGVDFPDKDFQNPIYEKMHLTGVDMVCWSNVSHFYPFGLHLTNSIIGSLFIRPRTSRATRWD